MSILLKISEITEANSAASASPIKAQLKITNASDTYINNLKLIISDHKNAITEQCIIRPRGSLCLDTILDQLELGNLAPDETAYFEYAFKPSEDLFSLSGNMIIRYTPERSEEEICEKIMDFLQGSFKNPQGETE